MVLPGRSMAPPFSVEQRRLILASTSVLKALGHTGFDRILLEFGVPEDVGSGASLMARANSLARYVLANPNVKVPDGSLLVTQIPRRARELNEQGAFNNVTTREREEFELASAAFDDFKQRDTAGPGESERSRVHAPVVAPDIPEDRPGGRPKARRKVFIVHGHDEGSRAAVARFLLQLDFEPIILHERPNRGRTVITKFQQEASDVGYAIVLMTPDDHGGAIGEESNPRARQNVVFELGFFIGALGPERVAAVMRGQIEKPSDFYGVVYIAFDDGTWKAKLAQELEAAGFEIDWKKAMK